MINTEGASVTIKMSAPYPPVEQPYPPQNQPYPPQNQPKMAAYPPQTGIGYPAYPPPAQAAYPPPTQAAYYPPPESGPMASMPPPPSYDSATAQPPPSYHAAAPKSGPDYGSADVGYSGEGFSDIVNFSNKSVRRGFIRKVFCILTLQLLTTVAAICVFMFVDPVRAFMRTSNGQAAYFASFGIFIALYIVLVCCDNVRRSHPANLIALSLFTISLSFMVGTISSYYETNIVLILMGVTALVCASVIIFSCQTKYDFTTWGGVLFCAALALFFLSIFTPLWLALNTTAGKIILGGFLALLFVAFLAYDVQLIMGGKKYELSPEEYIFASLTLYMDIVRIFLLLLALFGRGSS